KIYHQPSHQHFSKLRMMLKNAPADPTRAQGHVSIAWPVDLILDSHGKEVGFLMPRIDPSVSIKLLRVYNPRDRLKIAPGFTWRYLLRTSRNIASVISALHL